MIIQYVKGSGSRKHQNVGVLVAYKDPVTSQVVIGASKANVKAGDKFDKTRGMELAMRRVQTCMCEGRTLRAPASFEKDVERFSKRVQKYYKTEDVLVPEIDYINPITSW